MAKLQLQDVPLRQLQRVRRIGSVLLGPKALAGRGVQYVRQLAENGDMFELSGLADRVTLEQLLALSGTVWVTDADRGNFHAIIEVSASWLTRDAPQLESES